MTRKATAGLRERQKQQRREAILKSARRLFERHGIEDSSMAAIAAEAGVSTPTVFNYFGSKDELLLAIILQGHREAVDEDQSRPRRPSASLADDLCALLERFTTRSLEIFSKPVWRYADSTVIRQPTSQFVQRYSQIDRTLTRTIEETLLARPLETRRGGGFDAGALALILYNHWNGHYIDYIKDDRMTLDAHLAALLPEVRDLVDLIFDEP